MERKIMMILGEYGSAGLCISELLLHETRFKFIVAGRSSRQACDAAEKLNSDFSENRVRGMQVNASNTERIINIKDL